MIKIDRYLKFSIIVLDSDIMGWLYEGALDGAALLARKPKPDYFYDDLQNVFSPGTYVHLIEGDILLGVGDTHP